MNKLKNDRQFRRDTLFGVGILAGFFFLLWKSRYGTGAYDEPYYLTIPHRILKGDHMFSEEWSLGQFSAFLLLPAMKIYLLFKGTTEGIVVGFRYIYIVFQTVCTAVIYARIREKECGWLAAWLFFLFCPYDIMAVSYNTMAIAFMAITGVLLATAGENAKITWICTGVVFAAAVLCNPFLAVFYFLYTAAVAAAWQKGKRTGEYGQAAGNFGIRAWLFVTAGAAVLAALFVITVLLQSTPGELMENLPIIMNDPEHTSRSLFMIVKVYLSSYWNVYGLFLPVWAVLLWMAYLYRKDGERRKICFALVSFSSALSLLGFLPTIQNSYNFITVPITVCGMAAYIMTEKKDRKIFGYLFLFGFAFSFMANYASNQGMHAISMVMILADVAAVLFIGRFASQESSQSRGTGRFLITFVILIFTVQFGMQVYTKAVHTFWEEPVWNLNAKIEEGPLKGAVTTREKAEGYQRAIEDIKSHIKKDGPVLFVTKDTWCYLYADAEYGTFSSYLSGGMEQSAERWELYFEVHPDKIPCYIYIPYADTDFDWGAVVSEKALIYGYDVEMSAEAYHLYRK